MTTEIKIENGVYKVVCNFDDGRKSLTFFKDKNDANDYIDNITDTDNFEVDMIINF
jgi:hypothetical protein